MPPAGFEPATLGLKDAHMQGICRRYRRLRAVSAGWIRSEWPSWGHISRHESGARDGVRLPHRQAPRAGRVLVARPKSAPRRPQPWLVLARCEATALLRAKRVSRRSTAATDAGLHHGVPTRSVLLIYAYLAHGGVASVPGGERRSGGECLNGEVANHHRRLNARDKIS